MTATGKLVANAIDAVEIAARNAETAINRGAGRRSERFVRADKSAPITNPSCTDIVNQERPESSRDQSLVNAGTTAEAEKYTAMESNTEKESRRIVRHLSFIKRFRCKFVGRMITQDRLRVAGQFGILVGKQYNLRVFA